MAVEAGVTPDGKSTRAVTLTPAGELPVYSLDLVERLNENVLALLNEQRALRKVICERLGAPFLDAEQELQRG